MQGSEKLGSFTTEFSLRSQYSDTESDRTHTIWVRIRRPKLPLDLFINSVSTENREQIIQELESKGEMNAIELVFNLDSKLYASQMKSEVDEAFKSINEFKEA